ncbi:MAG TPA: hypothetical protein VEJ20_03250, partial [Candidatus Eremiobacteraceae bacterium]|nr:hypothetical protein [Candidatus Eremiobacteraceae bacterium]
GAGVLAASAFLRPADAAGYYEIKPDATVTCSSGGACQIYDNHSTGSALEGETGNGTGLLGDATKGGKGVIGESGTGFGVEGTSGSLATSIGGYFSALTGVEAEGSSTGVGLVAAGATGLQADSTTAGGTALQVYSDGGPLIEGFNSSDTDLFEIDQYGDLFGTGEYYINGTVHAQNEVSGGNSDSAAAGGYFDGEDWGLEGTNAASHDHSTGYGYAIYANGFGGDLFVGNNSSDLFSFVADDSGNLTITGQLYTSGSCSSGCARRADEPGMHVIKYTPSESEPTTEDFGEGQLVEGAGYVRIDPAFANTIDRSSTYMVFLTPKGDSRGLFVTDETAAGFEVRENQGGRSTLAFDYRIVAKPYGVSAARLPMVEMTADPRAKLLPQRPAVHLATGSRPALRTP